MSTVAELVALAGAAIILLGALRQSAVAGLVPEDRLSVAVALDRLNELDGKLVEIVGNLNVEYEGNCINESSFVSVSESEYRRTGTHSIWTSYGRRISEVELQKLHGQEVILTGYIRKPRRGYDGCGHFGAWPAELEVITVRALLAV